METLEEKTQKMEQGMDPWEGGSSDLTDGRIALCRVYAVNPEKRTCSIKTYGSDERVSNGDFREVQCLALYSSPLGDEISFVPELNSQAVCVFLGGTPYIIGFFQPITIDPTEEINDQELDGVEPSGGSAAQNKEKINVGDFILRTAGRCRVILRRGGEIELEATKLCRRTYFPSQNLINEISQNFESRTNGGTVDWKNVSSESDQTYFRQEWRDDISRSNVIIDLRGTIIVDDPLIHRFAIGPGVAPNVAQGSAESQFKPVLLKETLNTGETRFQINEINYDRHIKDDGETTLGINDYIWYSNIKPTGQMTININNNFQMVTLPSGETTLDIGIEDEKEEGKKPTGGVGKFKLNIKPDGTTEISINEKVNVKIESEGKVVVDTGPGKSTLTMEPTGVTTLKTETTVNIETKTANIKASLINLGENIADVVPMGRLLLTAINVFIAKFNAHTHVSPFLGINTSPPSPTQKTIKEEVLSATVKVQP